MNIEATALGLSELTSQSPQEFIDTIEELEEALFKMGRWAFAEEFCDPAELERAEMNSKRDKKLLCGRNQTGFHTSTELSQQEQFSLLSCHERHP